MSKSKTQLNRSLQLRYDAPHVSEADSSSEEWDFEPNSRGDDSMDVRGISQGVGPIEARSLPSTPQVQTPSTPNVLAPVDQLEISEAGKLLEKASSTGSLREERLNRIREEIAAGTYDTPEKLEQALLKMFDVNGLDLE